MVGFQKIRAAVLVAMLACIALGLLTGCATKDSSGVYQFTGAVELDGIAVNDGTTITAIIEGDEYRTTSSSIYSTSNQPGINLWLTIAVVIGLIACSGLICFLLYLDRMLRKLRIPATGSVSPSDSSALVIELYLE